MRKKLENNIQHEIVMWFRNNHCTTLNSPRCIIFSVANELPMQLATMTAKQLELKKVPKLLANVVYDSLKILLSRALSLGFLEGVSDLIVIIPNKVLFVELKTKTGRQREGQIRFQSLVEALGHKYYICRSLEDFKDVIQDEKN